MYDEGTRKLFPVEMYILKHFDYLNDVTVVTIASTAQHNENLLWNCC